MASSAEFFSARLQNALYDRLAAGQYLATSVVGGKLVIDHGAPVAPVSVLVHFTGSRFRRGLECEAAHVRDDWDLTAHIGFPVPVSVEGFEIDYLKSPVRVYNEDGEGYMVELKSVRYDEPPELGKGPSRVVASFVATQIQI